MVRGSWLIARAASIPELVAASTQPQLRSVRVQSPQSNKPLTPDSAKIGRAHV